MLITIIQIDAFGTVSVYAPEIWNMNFNFTEVTNVTAMSFVDFIFTIAVEYRLHNRA